MLDRYLDTTEGHFVPPMTIEEALQAAIDHGDMTIKEAEHAAEDYHKVFDKPERPPGYGEMWQ